MTERKIILVNQSDNKETLPFWDRHFASILALAGGIIAAFFAISDNAINLIVNQPPEVEIRLSKENAVIGDRIYARAHATDPGGDTNDVHFKWELFELDTILLDGIGSDYDRVDLPTDTTGEFTLLVTVTDKRGKGKYARNEAIYIVSEPSTEENPIVAANPVQPPPQIDNKIEYLSEISLTENSLIDWKKKQASRIITNGYSLDITGNTIASELRIVSFAAAAASGKPGSNGGAGANGGSQQDGKDGSSGASGMPGESGKDAGKIRIEVTDIKSNLTIQNSGQIGGVGGKGGNGGQGGVGGQGRSAKSGTFDCSRGPGRGGKGGNGGSGGLGGKGGNGGSAHSIEIIVSGSIDGKLEIVAKGGTGGIAGAGGIGGSAGIGGKEGRTSGLCGSAGRKGAAGRPGISGKSGQAGISGNEANIVVQVSGNTIESTGSYRN